MDKTFTLIARKSQLTTPATVWPPVTMSPLLRHSVLSPKSIQVRPTILKESYGRKNHTFTFHQAKTEQLSNLSTTKSKSWSEPLHSPYSSLHSTLRLESSLTTRMFWSSSGHLDDQTVLATTYPPFTGSARICRKII